MHWSEKQLADYQRARGVPSGRPNRADVSRPPFALPPEPIMLDLPVPPSVNKTRRYDFTHSKIVNAWKEQAAVHVLAAKTSALNPLRLSKITRFEIAIVLDEKQTKMDLDNGIKCLVDYLKGIGAIRDDAQKNMRGLTVIWGSAEDAPSGCRVFVRPCA